MKQHLLKSGATYSLFFKLIILHITVWSPYASLPKPTAYSDTVISESSDITIEAAKTDGLLVDRKLSVNLPTGSVTSYVGREHVPTILPPTSFVAVTVMNRGIPVCDKRC